MFVRKVHLILQPSQTILDLDAVDEFDYIAITNDGYVITPEHDFKINIVVKFPLIRKIDDAAFLILGARTDGQPNLNIFDFKGHLVMSFFVGDGVEDVLVHQGKIIVTYFDEGVVGSPGPNNDGVAVFDLAGEQLFGFNSSKLWGYMVDCYCIAKSGPNSVIFFAYPEFKVCELFLDTLKVEVIDVPEELCGATAIARSWSHFVFYGPYIDNTTFYNWIPNTMIINACGHYLQARLRGLTNGRFLSFSESGYSIHSVA